MEEKKFIVKPGRSVLCKMGIVHAGGIVVLNNFSGNKEAKEKIITKLIEDGYLELYSANNVLEFPKPTEDSRGETKKEELPILKEDILEETKKEEPLLKEDSPEETKKEEQKGAKRKK